MRKPRDRWTAPGRVPPDERVRQWKVRGTPEEREAWRDAAARDGRKFGGWSRIVLNAQAASDLGTGKRIRRGAVEIVGTGPIEPPEKVSGTIEERRTWRLAASRDGRSFNAWARAALNRATE